MQAITEYLHVERIRGRVRLEVTQARLRALLYESAQVLAERDLAEGGWELDIEIDSRELEELEQRENLTMVAEEQIGEAAGKGKPPAALAH